MFFPIARSPGWAGGSVMSHVSVPSHHVSSHPYLGAFVFPCISSWLQGSSSSFIFTFHAGGRGRASSLPPSEAFVCSCLGEDGISKGLCLHHVGQNYLVTLFPAPAHVADAREAVVLNISSRMCCCPACNRNSLVSNRGNNWCTIWLRYLS